MKNEKLKIFMLLCLILMIGPMDLGEVIYKAGENFGSSSVKFGRSLYTFYEDVKTIVFE